MNRFILANVRRALVLTFCILFAGTAAAQQPISKHDERASPAVIKVFKQVVAKPSESAVASCNGRGSPGAVVDPHGLVLTKLSLLSGEIKCRLRDGRVLKAEILGEHDGFDLAMLKIAADDLVPVQWRPARTLKQAMWLCSVGPNEDPVAIGVVGVLPRPFKPGDQPPKTGGPKSGFLGVSLEDTETAKIKSLQPGGPAEKAGVKVDDIVIEAASRKVTSVESMQSAVQCARPARRSPSRSSAAWKPSSSRPRSASFPRLSSATRRTLWAAN